MGLIKRSAALGATAGGVVGAITGATTIGEGFSTGASLFYGGGTGLVFGAALGAAAGSVGGLVAVAVLKGATSHRSLLARVVLAMCGFLAAAAGFELSPLHENTGAILGLSLTVGIIGWFLAADTVNATMRQRPAEEG